MTTPGHGDTTSRDPGSTPRYRIVAHELIGDTETVIMDATGANFIAAVGTINGEHLNGQLGHAGDPHELEHVADLITNTFTRKPKRRPR